MGGNQSAPATDPAAARRGRRRENHRSYFLIFGEPRVRYTGQGRGPLLFHVATPAPDTEEAVDSAATFRCPVSACGVTFSRSGGGVVIEAQVRALAECTARAVLGGSVDVEREKGISVVDGTSLGASSLKPSHDGDAPTSTLTFRCSEAQWTDATNDRDGPAPDSKHRFSENDLCLVFEFSAIAEGEAAGDTDPDDRDERADPACVKCAMYCLFRVDSSTTAAPSTSYRLPSSSVLLQRDVSVFKLENVFDMGGDAKPEREGSQDDNDDDSDDADGVCVVCIENPKDTVVLPCRHMCMCSECAQAVRNQRGKCPMCRTDIERLMKRS